MENKIKKFFQKKKADANFKLAGPGRKLNAPNVPSTSKDLQKKKDVYIPPSRSGLSHEAEAAAAAALARVEKKASGTAGFNTSLAAIRAQVKSEIEAEKNTTKNIDDKKTVEPPTLPSKLAATGVFFRCPMISDEVLSQEDWQAKIKEFLYEQLPSDPGLTAVLMIYSLNKSSEKVKVAVDTLAKYLENITNEPNEEKYRKIRKSNKAFVERILPIEGGCLFLEGAGFKSDGEFYVFPDENVNEETLSYLNMLIDALKTAEPISLTVDRNLKVLMPSQATSRTDLPRDFFIISPEDLKREQQAKIEAMEKSSMLMTKAMREKEELRELRNYRFCLIRVRFPDGIILQGTFGVYEPFRALTQFVEENLEDATKSFTLISPLGEKFDNVEEKTLFELRLIPASILLFVSEDENYLKPEVMILCQED